MDINELEFSISQYVDGTLPDEARPALEEVLATDSSARALLAQERAMTELLRLAPRPHVQWEEFGDQVSAAIDEQSQVPLAGASFWMRLRTPVALAAAASVLLAIGLAVHMSLGRKGAIGIGTAPVGSQVVVTDVRLSEEEPSGGPAVIDVSIGPGGRYANDDSPLAPYADEIDSRPARVIIASGIAPEVVRVSFPD